MAETVGQHSVAAFTSPVNGTTPIDANTVRGNDNTVRSAYVDHDADPGIHVQSSTLASRPVAGTAGRKWITVSSGRYQLWYDDGSRWNEVASDAINVDCLADTALTKGDVVKITGFNNGQNLPTVAKVSASTDTAFGLVENTVSSGAIVQIINTGLIEDVDTNGYAVGTVLYPNTSGGWTTTKPTSGNYQPAGYVLRGNTNTGVLYVEFSAPRIVERSDNTASTIVLRDASGNFSAGTITATTLAGTLSTAAQPNVTSVGTLTSLAVSGDLTVDTSTLKVDSTNNRVGIGTASPTDALDVRGVAAFGNGTVKTIVSYSSLGIFGTESNHSLSFVTNATEKMRLDTSGNLGLGVTPSALTLSGRYFEIGYKGNGVLSVSDGTSFVSNAYYDGAWKYGYTGAAAYYANSAGQHRFYTAPSGTAGNAITFTQAMTLDASGNLAVGTATALGTAAGRGNITVNGSGTSILSFGVGSSLAGYVLHEGTDMWVNNTLAGALRLYTNGSERARITSGGYFKASNDGTYTGSTSNYHEFRNSTSNVVLDVKATNASYADTVFVVGASRAASSAFTIIAAQANSVNQFAVTGDGVIYAQNTTVQSLSDARLKENVVDATEGLAVITALRPVRYDWKAGYGNDRTNQLGFIAQEVEAVFPDAVSAWAMDEPTGEVDEDGKPITEKVDYKTVGPGALIPVLVKAIQELEARIAVLEAGA